MLLVPCLSFLFAGDSSDCPGILCFRVFLVISVNVLHAWQSTLCLVNCPSQMTISSAPIWMARERERER